MEKEIGKSVIRIALIGPESSAKSSLSEALAIHYKTVWVPERARLYLKDNSNYSLNDIEQISLEQIRHEKELLKKANTFLFADTEMIISKVWCLDVFKTCPPWIEQAVVDQNYDLYLLTCPDLPWEPDALRENPHRRDFFFNWYQEELENIKAQYSIISGQGKLRLSNAIAAIEIFLEKNKINT